MGSMKIKLFVMGALLSIGVGSSAGAAENEMVKGKWTYMEVKDPITDAVRGIAYLRGDGGMLAVKCDKNGPNTVYLGIFSDKFLGALRSSDRSVIERVDDGPVLNEIWWHNQSYAILTENGKAVERARVFAAAKKIVFRLTDFQGSDVDVALTSDGTGDAVQKAMTTCGQR